MKYRVIGWTYYGDSQVEFCDADSAAYAAIVDEIKKNRWYFSGWNHQETGYGVPVLNDGKARRFSQRGWGGVMAEAYGYYGTYDYSLFAEGSFRNYDNFKMPSEDLYPDDFLPETYLNEDIRIEVAQETFDKVCEGSEVSVAEEGRVRYIGRGDTLLLVCGGKSTRYITDEVTKRLHILPDDVRRKIDKKADSGEFNQAVAIAAETPVTRWVRLGRCVDGEKDIETLAEHRQVDNVNKHHIETCLSIRPNENCRQAVEDFLDDATDDWMQIGDTYKAGSNTKYNVDVNVMIRRTLKDFFGREDELKKLAGMGAYIALEIVPEINLQSQNPYPILSLSADIIAFLHNSSAVMDLDYYIFK